MAFAASSGDLVQYSG